MTTLGGLGRRRLTTDIAIQLVGRALNLALGVIVTVALVRFLGESDFGKWATILSITSLVTAAGAQTLPRVVVPRAAADPDGEPSWLGALLSLQSLIVVPGTLICLAIVALVSRGNEMLVCGLIMSLLIALNLPAALSAVFQLRVRNDVSTILSLANSVIWTAGVLLVNKYGGGLVALAVLFVGAQVVTQLATLALSVRWVKIDWAAGKKLRRMIVRIAVPVGLFGLAVTAYNQIDQLIVFEFAGSVDAGLYGAVYRILDQAGVFPAAIVTTFAPIMAATYKTDLTRVHRLVQAAADMLAILSFGGIAVALAAGAPILRLLYGEGYGAAAPSLVLLMVAFVLIGLGYVYGSMVVVLGIQRAVLRYALLALAVNISLNLIFVPIFGYTAAAAVTVVTEFVVLWLTMRVAGPMMKFKLSYAPMVRTALAAGIMCLLVWLMRKGGVPVGVLIAASVLIYVAALFAFRAVDRRELLSLVTEKA
jgi:O-antigen/teichoic acid export membrane protein